MESFADRLLFILKKFNIKQKEFAKTVKISPSTLSEYKKGTKKPSMDTLYKISTEYSINLNWLLTGKGEMFLFRKTNNKISNLYNFGTEMVEIEKGSDISAGDGILVYEDDPILFPRALLAKEPQAYFAITVNGNSMLPNIHDGELAIIQKDSFWENAYDKVAAIRIDGMAHLKRVLKFDNFIVLQPFNPAFQSITLSAEDQHRDIALLGLLYLTIHTW